MDKPKLPVFDQAVAGFLFCFLLSFYLFHRATKNKADFDVIKGVVEYIGDTISFYPDRKRDRFRYLKVNSYRKPFELFVGKGSGDFKPELDNVDGLKQGDSVAVYFDNNPISQEGPVNRLVYFIDRKNEPVFVKGSWEKYLAYFIAGFCAVMVVVVLVLWKKRKIV